MCIGILFAIVATGILVEIKQRNMQLEEELRKLENKSGRNDAIKHFLSKITKGLPSKFPYAVKETSARR